MTEGARDGFDYVVVARLAALERPYHDLLADIRRAFAQIHKTPTAGTAKPAKRPPAGDEPGNSRKIS